MPQEDLSYLLFAMTQYGYSLLEPERMADPNELLAKLSQSEDSRLLEGFPVVLANALEKHGDKVDLTAAEKLLKDEPRRKRLRRLVAFSTYMFGTFGFDGLKSSAERLSPWNQRLLPELRRSADNNEPFREGRIS